MKNYSQCKQKKFTNRNWTFRGKTKSFQREKEQFFLENNTFSTQFY